jgi:predicted nuclease with TOPRIM domain
MSTDDSPREGTDQENRTRHAELEELPNEALALELEGAKEDLRSAANEVTYALLNEDAALTDGDVSDLSDAVHELRAGVEAVTQRVPPEHRHGE